jgi:hypothetical protein
MRRSQPPVVGVLDVASHPGQEHFVIVNFPSHVPRPLVGLIFWGDTRSRLKIINHL